MCLFIGTTGPTDGSDNLWTEISGEWVEEVERCTINNIKLLACIACVLLINVRGRVI